MDTLKIMLDNIRQQPLLWKVPFTFSGVCLVFCLPLMIATAIFDPAEAARQLRIVSQVIAVAAISAIVLLILVWMYKEMRARRLQR